MSRSASRATRDTAGRRHDSRWPSGKIQVRLGALVIALAVAGVYANSLSAPFVFDDGMSILENPSIRHLWPLGDPLRPPADGSSVTGRPVVNLTLALNHALGGFAVEGYHVFNVAVHLASALLLFGLVRRTLALAWAPPALRTHAAWLGFVTALIWSVHPLHTESVTYVIQRAEALGGLAILAVLYGFARATDPATKSPLGWRCFTVGCCVVGMATKETVAAAPLLVLCFDRAFVAGTFAEAWRQRRGLHGLLFASWLILAALIWQGGARGGSVGFEADVGPWTSLLTQCDAIAMYLKLAFWPHPLVFDHGSSVSDRVTDLTAIIPQAILLAALLGATLWALLKRPALGFVGAWFFLILAPSSSFVPILSQMRAEHRMYLPLAALVVLVVVALRRGCGRWAWGVVGAAAVALAATTVVRNRDYHSAMTLWADTVRKVPENPRAHYNLAFELARSGDRRAAIDSYATAVRLDPTSLMARTNLATLLVLEGRAADALPHAEAAVRLAPDSATAHNVLGRARFETRDAAGALRAFEEAVRLNPDDAGAQKNLGLALVNQGQPARALEHLERSANLHADAGLRVLIGETHLELGRTAAARESFEAALQLQPDHAMAHFHLGNLLAAADAFAEALPHYEAAVRGLPRAVPPLFNLAVALSSTGRTTEAIVCLQRVLQLDPGDADAAEMLQTLQRDRP